MSLDRSDHIIKWGAALASLMIKAESRKSNMTLTDDCYTANPFLNFFPDYDRTMHISQNIDQSLFPSTLQSVEKGLQFWAYF